MRAMSQCSPNRSLSSNRPLFCIGVCILFVTSLAWAAPDTISSDTGPIGLDRGYQRLYNLDFSGAQKEFETWEKEHPQNAMGPASQAAGILFAEFDRLGVLESQFYETDSAFASR